VAIASDLSLQEQASHGPVPFLLYHIRRRWGGHAAVLAAVFAAVACAVGSQYGIKNLVDALGTRDLADSQLWGAVAILVALVAGDNLLWRLAGWISTYCFVAVGGDMRLGLFHHLSGHGTRYFTEQFPGGLAGRITTAASAAWTIENSLTWTTIPPAAAVVGSIAVLGLINWHMTLVLFVVIAVLGLAIARAAAKRNYLHQRYAGRAAAVSGDLTDVVSNIGLVRAFGAASRERSRLSESLTEEMTAQRASLRALERIKLFHALSVFLVTVGILVWSVTLWRAGRITTGDVVLTTTLGFTLLHASRDVAMALVELVQQFAKLGEAVKVLGQPHEIVDAPDAQTLINLGGAIDFSKVCFSYPGSERVLQDFDLHIDAGQKVGLVGKSGAGKSTVLALMQRLYDPETGRVLVDGQDIAKVAQESLRQSIAVVHQDISVFHRSVLENLRYGRPEATEDEIYRAAEAARCLDFIHRLPQGFDTIVGERGLKLSGGERQRLAIARAFLRNAPIILLDEATSALDTESEQLIQDALARLIKGRTVVAIAHRLSTLAAFDRILVLERGRIVEDGTAAELMRLKGTYAGMFNRQFGSGRQ
jgi:ATP-binding cassette, subfamily B, bacterial